jgi:hypothetical protein
MYILSMHTALVEAAALLKAVVLGVALPGVLTAANPVQPAAGLVQKANQHLLLQGHTVASSTAAAAAAAPHLQQHPPLHRTLAA